ncbi:hypothetical protein [Streptococcus sp. O1]|uniref:hypothetical protein n=1 Tax=Streptococcus sp. O1 TaxID=2928735 RepID=UPI00277D06AE|nr:hypothetical protein [Streptococcus sp. O1]
MVQKLLHQLNPLASDEAYLSFKQEEIKERLEFVALQLKPKYQLSEKEEEKKQAYALKYADSIRLPIKQASPETIQQALARLKEEFRLSEAVQDEQLFPLFKGSSTNKQAYQDELRNHVTIFQLKKDIYERNQEIKEADSEIKSRLKQENAKAFERLKREYQKLSDRNDKEKGQEQQIENIVKRQLQAQKEYHRQQLQGNKQQKRFQASPSFMKGLSQILGTKDRSQMRALMQKVRDDEREEREKVRGR